MCTTSIWVEVITFLYHVCYAMIEPAIRIHIYESSCEVHVDDANYTDCASLSENLILEDKLQTVAANSIVYLKLIRALPALLIIIFCGAWSDNIGRKLPILFPFIGMLLSLFLYLISYASPDVFSTILAGGLLSGLFGEVGLILMAGYSYVTDVTEKPERTKRLGRLMAMSFFGQFLGSLIIAIMIKLTEAKYVFIFAAVINALAIVVIITFLQDSLRDKTQTVVLCKMTYLAETWQVIAKPREGRKRFFIIIVLSCMAIHQACLWGEGDITMLYVRHRPLKWSASQYGYYLTGGFFASGIGTLFLLPLLTGYFKVNDISLSMAAVGFKVVQMAWQAFSNEDWMVYFCLPMMLVSSMFVPSLKSLLSKLIDDDEVGKIFGVSAFGETLCGLFGSLIFTALYGATVKLFSGTSFILQAVVNVALFVVILKLSSNYQKHLQELPAEQEGETSKPDIMKGVTTEKPTSEYKYDELQLDETQPAETDYLNQIDPSSSNQRYSLTSYQTQSACSDSEESEYAPHPHPRQRGATPQQSIDSENSAPQYASGYGY